MITIKLTPLSYRVAVGPDGQLLGTSLSLRDYIRKFNHTGWDRRSGYPVVLERYLHYDRKSSTLYLPRYDFESFCQFLGARGIAYAVENVPLQAGRAVHIPLKPHVQDRNERQTQAIAYLTTCEESQRGLSLNTGVGKTYCAVKSVSILGARAMICVAGLIDQWKRSFLEFTELAEEDIYVVQGAASMTKLLLQIDKTLFPKVILCSLGTVRNYAIGKEAYENYPPFHELFDRLGVGVKVVDEAHLNFWVTMMIDLQTNAAVNISLTATFDRTDPQEKRFFDAHYPRMMRFGEGEFEKYIDIHSYSYSLGYALPAKSYRTINGYNHSKFEDYLLRRVPKRLEYIFTTVYSPAIFAHYVNLRRVGQKLLVLCARLEMCRWFRDRLVAELPSQENFSIAVYNSENPDGRVLAETDIIISTPGSAGTGTDIKDLRTVLMTIATGSDNTNKQTLGRLRELKTGDTPHYVSTWCQDIPEHAKYQERRRYTFQTRGKSFTEVAV